MKRLADLKKIKNKNTDISPDLILMFSKKIINQNNDYCKGLALFPEIKYKTITVPDSTFYFAYLLQPEGETIASNHILSKFCAIQVRFTRWGDRVLGLCTDIISTSCTQRQWIPFFTDCLNLPDKINYNMKHTQFLHHNDRFLFVKFTPRSTVLNSPQCGYVSVVCSCHQDV